MFNILSEVYMSSSTGSSGATFIGVKGEKRKEMKAQRNEKKEKMIGKHMKE